MEEKESYNYEDLLVWQKAMDLAESVYLKTRSFPKEELYGLTSQLRRAVLSIPLNIAEGQGRGSENDFRRFLLISRGSAYEMNSILQMCVRLGFINEGEYRGFRIEVISITKMISGLMRSLG
jgi:four helix bundle protein